MNEAAILPKTAIVRYEGRNMLVEYEMIPTMVEAGELADAGKEVMVYTGGNTYLRVELGKSGDFECYSTVMGINVWRVATVAGVKDFFGKPILILKKEIYLSQAERNMLTAIKRGERISLQQHPENREPFHNLKKWELIRLHQNTKTNALETLITKLGEDVLAGIK